MTDIEIAQSCKMKEIGEIAKIANVDEKYVERAFEKLKKNGCPEGEDLLTWFGKLVSAEIVSDALRIDDNEGNN